MSISKIDNQIYERASDFILTIHIFFIVERLFGIGHILVYFHNTTSFLSESSFVNYKMDLVYLKFV